MEDDTKLLDLPPEMLIRIFKLCPRIDLINITCCNRKCYHLIVHFLCQYFEIRWQDITSTLRITDHICNLKLCTCVVFYNGSNPFYAGPSWDDVSKNYLRILRLCNDERLRTLYIIKSKISDVALELTLNKFKNVQSLRLEECNEVTTSSLTYLGDICSLKKLHINTSGVTDNDISNLTKLPQLEDLSIILCPAITNASLYSIGRISTLKRFHYCEYGILDPDGFANLVNLTNLKVLDIGGCLISKDDLIYLMDRLTHLDILNVGSIIITVEEFSHISRISCLTRLGLSGCNILDEELVCLQGLTSLQTLDLSWHNDISDIGLVHICRVPSLMSLSLRFCNKVSDEGIQLLAVLPLLRILDISVCELLTDTCLSYLSVFPSLRVLHASECIGITEGGISNLMSIRNIRLEERDFDLEDRENLGAN